MPPPPIRVLATLLMGLPGACLWLGGLSGSALIVAAAASGTEAPPRTWITWAGALLLAVLLGSAMIKGWQLFVTGNRHALPLPRAASLLGIGLAGQILGVSALSLLIVAASELFDSAPAVAVPCLAIALAAGAASVWLHRAGFSLRRRWNMEYWAERQNRQGLAAGGEI